MRYRNLTFQELTVMREDFSEFLYTEGFSGYDWKILQDQHSEQAVDMLSRYSEHTFEKVMQSVQYLEYRNQNQLIAYKCLDDDISAIGIKAPEKLQFDFTSIQSLEVLEQNFWSGFKCFKEVRPYIQNREEEVFQLIEAGHYVSTKENYHYLESLRLLNQN